MGLFNKMMTKIKKEVSSQSFELFSQSGGLRPLFCSNKFYKQPLALPGWGWWVFHAFFCCINFTRNLGSEEKRHYQNLAFTFSVILLSTGFNFKSQI